jgi:hypothetical protein
MTAFAVRSGQRDLSKYTTSTDEDQAEFLKTLREQRKVDDALWK